MLIRLRRSIRFYREGTQPHGPCVRERQLWFLVMKVLTCSGSPYRMLPSTQGVHGRPRSKVTISMTTLFALLRYTITFFFCEEGEPLKYKSYGSASLPVAPESQICCNSINRFYDHLKTPILSMLYNCDFFTSGHYFTHRPTRNSDFNIAFVI